MGRRAIDLTGEVFGRLTVIERAGTRSGKAMWRCRCECGNETTVPTGNLRTGNYRSCGCLRTERLVAWKAANPAGDNLEYPAAHNRVRRVRGKASEHACIDCGGQAREWSYPGGCPRELISICGRWKGTAYSPDPDQYVPRCVSCHRIHDHAMAKMKGEAG